MVTSDQLETSKAIQRRTGRTFHVATRFLPERVRHPTYVLYAFFRLADDVVDDGDPPSAAAQRAELDRIRAAALGRRPADDPVLAAFDDLRERREIPDGEVETFLDAMAADVDHDGYETHADLAAYLRGSSVAVANMLLAVMEPADREAAKPHAEALAEAFQLTNFLRDVREDAVEYDRVYVPRASLAEHGVTRDQIADLEFSPAFGELMRAELRRTEASYREGVAGIRHLPDDCQFPVLLAAVLYAEHHRLIRERQYDVLGARPSLGMGDYLRLLAGTWWHWRRRDNPEAVFYRVSAVAERPRDGPSRDADPVGRPAAGAIGRSVARLTERVRSQWPVGEVE
jgi:phytoene synthase